MFVFPNIFGAYDTRQLPSLRIGVAGVTEAAVMDDINTWAKFINEVADSYINLLSYEESQPSGTFGNGTGGGEMQPYTEFGNTEATKTGESSWSWGLPIRRFRDAQLYTEEYIATKSLLQLNKDIIAATNRFLTSKVKMVLRALFGAANYVFNDTIFPGSDKGSLAVKRLFNADGTVGTMFVNGTAVSIGTLQSYIPSTSATVVVGQFTLNRTKLRERGYTGRVIHLISETDSDTVKALSGFIAAPVDNPYVNVTNGPAVTTTTAVVTQPRAIGVFSNGGLSDGEVIAYPFWPAGYVMSFDATKSKPVGIRQHEDAKYHGWRLVQDETRAPYGEAALRHKKWEFIAGAGVVNRANGVISLATVGAYAPPTL